MPSSGAIFLPRDQTCTSCFLHWHAGSSPLAPPGKPDCFHVGLFPSALFCPSALSNLLPVLHCLDCCSFIGGLEVGYRQSFKFILLLEYCVGYSVSFTSPGKNQLVDWWDIFFF